ncbi:hydroxyacylglutathione hydrolase [Cohaesibacter sp. ES.047]|uniref:hydroxyacylglutathione hydrolase n=1 Tax=Cohaesibacter sp. ES.047 TaxID=1798205 RepID=UPI000BB988DA|nr:hydroxyacylglutathione hydrolase [Cohaesibacter sp. ES.047]SNY90793.1 hydroxyacylglutathione hydrolase [Cohaesibacter sp. ES.047]
MTKHALVTKLIPCLSDNYAVLAHDPEEKVTILVDAPQDAPILEALEETGCPLTHILITHHHHDHVGGLAAIKAKTGAQVWGPEMSREKIGLIDHGVDDGNKFKVGAVDVFCLGTPGHTLDHISYWIPDAQLAFTGDTLFALGCGRVFEGTLKDMWFSVDKLAKLPPETTIFCGHEYTQTNAEFCLTIEPDNELLQARAADIRDKRAKGEPTIPSSMLDELTTNSFVRANHPDVKEALGMEKASDAEVFAEIRRRKDRF